ncbi:cold-shock protein [Haliangium ochraceum]|uniref:Cold-shock DNA-binding domain protein n=1 Tax=Haliangium ochraceum (strain DSM 14365 / JCM 11303 / SMP-2) TaxID=502025 RepID=D0LU49_HALO1|nr:cold-shock DNA-binding domain protein [Haliangium ochraceum DSM 14365]
MPTGAVKWFNNVKGYGFILREDGQDVFVHWSNILADGYRLLTEGEIVEYELQEGPKGLFAAQVKSRDPSSMKPARGRKRGERRVAYAGSPQDES